jgi:hypothetical protein
MFGPEKKTNKMLAHSHMMDEDTGTTIRYTVTRYTGTYLVEEPPEL